MPIKHLITSGCSFSECVNWYNHKNPDNRTWPVALAERFTDAQHHSGGMGGQGNSLVAKKTMYYVSQLLKTSRSEELLVGVMWTGRDRFDFYFEEPIKFTENIDGWMENPVQIIDGAPGGWVILNPHWNHSYNGHWYRHYYNEVAAQIYTLEHIVNLQNFLKLHQVPYFFTNSFNVHIDMALVDNPNCAWLYEQIDWDYWLPVKSERHWVEENCEIPGANNFHPRSEQHELFVDQVIMPWLKERQIT